MICTRFVGNEISVIFQEPMTSLNPVYTIEKQLNEVYLTHQKISKEEASKKITGDAERGEDSECKVAL